MTDTKLRVRYQRPGLPPRTLRDVRDLEADDHVHMLAAQGQMSLIYERRGVHRVLRCHTLSLTPRAPRGQGLGTALHRAVEARVRELGLLFCTADDETVEGNKVTSAMRQRLLERYPDHVRVGDAYVLRGEPQDPKSPVGVPLAS